MLIFKRRGKRHERVLKLAQFISGGKQHCCQALVIKWLQGSANADDSARIMAQRRGHGARGEIACLLISFKKLFLCIS